MFFFSPEPEFLHVSKNGNPFPRAPRCGQRSKSGQHGIRIRVVAVVNHERSVDPGERVQPQLDGGVLESRQDLVERHAQRPAGRDAGKRGVGAVPTKQRQPQMRYLAIEDEAE